MDGKKKLTVFTPTYNRAHLLKRVYDSLVWQKSDDFIWLIIDDGSTDGSGVLCDRISEKYDNVRVIHKCNEGLGFARNTGIKNAKGSYITFIDSDDLVSHDYLKKMMGVVNENNYDVLYSENWINFKDIKEVNNYRNCDSLAVKDYHQKDVRFLQKKIIWHNDTETGFPRPSACLAFYKLETLKIHDLEFVSERQFIGEDLWFNLDFVGVSQKVGVVNCRGYFYRYNEASLSRSYRSERFNLLVESGEQLMKKCISLGLSDYQGTVFLNCWPTLEKSINQEIRNGSKHLIPTLNDIRNNQFIVKMMNDDETIHNLSGFHHLLFILFKNKCFSSIIVLLKIYNIIFH